jgi:hypothetical protein
VFNFRRQQLHQQQPLAMNLLIDKVNNNKPQRVARDYLAAGKIKFDYTALRVAYTQYNHNGNYSQVAFTIFPNPYGFDNPMFSNETRVMSPWRATSHRSDANKAAFIDAKKQWAEKYSEPLAKEFESGKQRVLIED